MNNIDAERSVLGCLIKYGDSVFYDINAFVKDLCFTRPEHVLLYSVISKLIDKDKLQKLDAQCILNECLQKDRASVGKYQLIEYINELSDLQVVQENAEHFAKIVARLALLRELNNNLGYAQEEIKNSGADRPILEIVASAERRFHDFTNKLVSHTEDTQDIPSVVDGVIDYYAQARPTHMGIPTGFPLYDKALGGGIRGPGISLIGARSKGGKSFLGITIGKNVTSLGIPVLYLDTEMSKEILITRLIASIAGFDINDIEKGVFATNPEQSRIMDEAKEVLKKLPLKYHNISGFAHSQTISVIRRWVNNHVGFDENGNLKPALVILDYIKTMDIREFKNIQEYQYLGQYMTDLHNFCVPYKLPVLAFVQLNRDGIDREDSGAVSGSDRLIWLCTSFSILKKKTDEDFVTDPITNGDRKILVKDTRFGEGLENNEYINIKTDLSKGIITEGKSNNVLKRSHTDHKKHQRTTDKDVNNKSDDEIFVM